MVIRGTGTVVHSPTSRLDGHGSNSEEFLQNKISYFVVTHTARSSASTPKMYFLSLLYYDKYVLKVCTLVLVIICQNS